MFQFITTQVKVLYRTYLWSYCIMYIQSIWLCDTWSGKNRQIVNIQLPDVEKTINVGLLCHSPSSVEGIEAVHSKARERWGHLKSWKRIPGSTKQSWRQMGDDVNCQASCDETAGAVCIRIWCRPYGQISKSSSIHSIMHSTYHVLSRPSSEEHKSLAWSCVIIETKAGSSTGSQAAEELGWESQIK